MKILYLDLGLEPIEDYNRFPKKYGGARSVVSSLLYNLDNFELYADEKCFEGIEENILKKCHTLSLEQRQKIREGVALDTIISEAKNFDILLHHSTNVYVNTFNFKINQFVWSVGWGEIIEPRNKYVLLFDKEIQNPQFSSANHTIYDIILGLPIPKFEEYKKEGYIFNCCRQTKLFQSAKLAEICQKHKIPAIFAGPIDKDYELEFLQYIDDKSTQYIGIIDEETKIKLSKPASAHVMLQTYPISVTLSAKQALAYGVPILATPVGGWPAFIKNAYNGFIVRNEEHFLMAWGFCKNNKVQQKNCWDSIQIYSEQKMIDSFLKVFEYILNK
ncbi:MAG: glycosyltransferase [Nanoarchaeota archaeon]